MPVQRSDFPLLKQYPELIYVDNAATTQKPQSVIQAITDYYEKENANVHRGVHTLGDLATQAYEESRQTVATFIHAPRVENVFFTAGTTHGLNALCWSVGEWLRSRHTPHELTKQVIVASVAEHNSNLLPWMRLAQSLGCIFELIPIHKETGILDEEAATALLDRYGDRVAVVALSHVSNVLGMVNPIASLVQKIHRVKAKFILDAAQSIAHMPVSIKELGVDALVFSGHKLYGPMGTGVLYIEPEWADQLLPAWVGGGMVSEVTVVSFKAAELPAGFEAGTPHVAGAVGLAAAINFVEHVGWQALRTHEQEILEALLPALREVPGVAILGSDKIEGRSGLVSFTVKGIHPHDVGGFLDQEQIAIRAGHHCTQVLHQHLQITASARISLGVYNSVSEVEKIKDALQSMVAVLG